MCQEDPSVNPILRETVMIVVLTFVSSAGVSLLANFLLKWPLIPVYLFAVLTIGPTLAILRGRNREKDTIEVGERAGVEILALIILLGIGWLMSRFGGR